MGIWRRHQLIGQVLFFHFRFCDGQVLFLQFCFCDVMLVEKNNTNRWKGHIRCALKNLGLN